MSQYDVVEDYVLVTSVLRAETAGDGAQLGEPHLPVEGERGGVGGHDGVELDYAEPLLPGRLLGVGHEEAPHMSPADVGTDGVAAVGDVPAAADVVGVEDVEPQDLAGVGVGGDAGVRLGLEELHGLGHGEGLLLGEGVAFLDDGVPDKGRLLRVGGTEGPYFDGHDVTGRREDGLNVASAGGVFEDLECDGEPAPADALVDLDMRPVLVPAGLEVGCVAAAAEGTITNNNASHKQANVLQKYKIKEIVYAEVKPSIFHDFP